MAESGGRRLRWRRGANPLTQSQDQPRFRAMHRRFQGRQSLGRSMIAAYLFHAIPVTFSEVNHCARGTRRLDIFYPAQWGELRLWLRGDNSMADQDSRLISLVSHRSRGDENVWRPRQIGSQLSSLPSSGYRMRHFTPAVVRARPGLYTGLIPAGR